MQKVPKYALLFLLFLLTFLSKAADLDELKLKTNNVLGTYVHSDHVKYHDLFLNRSSFDDLYLLFCSYDAGFKNDKEERSFLLNYYNLSVIHQVLEHYPMRSPQEFIDFFDETFIPYKGQKISLSSLESLISNQNDDVLSSLLINKGARGSFCLLPLYIDLNDSIFLQAFQDKLSDSKKIVFDSFKNFLNLPVALKNINKPAILAFLNSYLAFEISVSVYIEYSNFDWDLNSFNKPDALHKKGKLQKFNPMSSLLSLRKGGLEFTLFNNLYTATYGKKSLGGRNSYFNSLLTAHYGISDKVDVGFTALFRSIIEDDHFDASPFKTLLFNRNVPNAALRNNNNHFSDFGLSHLGFQARISPFNNFNMAFEQSILFPISNLPANNEVDNNFYSITNIYYYHFFSQKTQLFLALTFWQPFNTVSSPNLNPPLLRAILNHFTTPNFSFFVTTMYFLEWGGGIKWMLTPNFEIQLMYTYFLPIPSVLEPITGSNSIMTYNLGLRYRI